jgi:hypothetical protein
MKSLNILKSTFLLLTVVLLMGTMVNAQTKKPKTASKTSKVAETKPVVKPEIKTEVKSNEPKSDRLKSHGKEIQKIIKNETGVIRGYDFGTTKQKIKETEDAQYVADGKDFIIYALTINEKEKAEIIYYLDESEKVKGFGVAFLVSTNDMANNLEATLIDDFQKYFTERYGKFLVNDKNDEVWTSQDGYTVEMGDSSEDASMVEIEIEIFRKK